jgi:hypothetical protein
MKLKVNLSPNRNMTTLYAYKRERILLLTKVKRQKQFLKLKLQIK